MPVDKSTNGSGAPGNMSRAAPRSPPCRSDAFMWGIAPVAFTVLALLIEAMVGYPDRLVSAIGHPVIWIGRLIAMLGQSLNHDGAPFASRRAAGIIALAIVVAVPAAIAYGLEWSLL